MTQAPRSGSLGFDRINEIFYGTDDGFEKSPFEEAVHDDAHVAALYEIFQRYEAFYQQTAPARRERIHLAGVIGGLYVLNLIPMFRPREITLFDVNPHAVTLFNLIRRVWIGSKSSDEFLQCIRDFFARRLVAHRHLDDFARHIVGITSATEQKAGCIAFPLSLHVLDQSRRTTDAHNQNAGRHRVERARMPGFGGAHRTDNLIDNRPRRDSRRFIDVEQSEQRRVHGFHR